MGPTADVRANGMYPVRVSHIFLTDLCQVRSLQFRKALLSEFSESSRLTVEPFKEYEIESVS